jgi:hypothetical protein
MLENSPEGGFFDDLVFFFTLGATETFFITVFLSSVDLLLHRLSLAACGPGQNSVKIFLSEAAF